MKGSSQIVSAIDSRSASPGSSQTYFEAEFNDRLQKLIEFASEELDDEEISE